MIYRSSIIWLLCVLPNIIVCSGFVPWSTTDLSNAGSHATYDTERIRRGQDFFREYAINIQLGWMVTMATS